MGGLLLLLVLCVVMALASFLAGALPLSLTLSQSQLRLISSIGVGILVGTSLIVIIPEGIEAIASTTIPAHTSSHTRRYDVHGQAVSPRWEAAHTVEKRSLIDLETGDSPRMPFFRIGVPMPSKSNEVANEDGKGLQKREGLSIVVTREDTPKDATKPSGDESKTSKDNQQAQSERVLPTFYIGFSLTLGFILMFLIDRIPRQAMDQFQPAPTTRHISLDNLASSSGAGEEESQGFLGSLAPTPKHSRSLATTTGLVIHAAADGIAMGASATTSNMKLGLIIFAAIMIHKAPASFGLTSVLLKQGLSKRAARGHLIVFSLAAPAGAIGTYLLVSILGGQNVEGESGQWWTGMLLLFSAGTFLYVAMHAMQEENTAAYEHHGGMNGYADNGGAPHRKQIRPQLRDTLATVFGMLLPLLTQFGHHH
ncbi:uncharacterized protein PgNI_09861 [Pyricularia grisea]|uniref:Uncharacterized protein n=1 Tax=Pyricularia grisea TaxID=148305 RepID=A0A6P8ATZ4_PYRGI|nr:uncharacterized protein PgNI_09861 [Pyricularia grisea]TLD05578.1 hypothetical protein PgNI_09861 [Pyricularia grisea]